MPAEIDNWLYAIVLHGREENYSVLDTMSFDVHQYFLNQRMQALSAKSVTARTGPKAGRNEPCPCGNGKKFKQCCLQCCLQ